MCRGVPPAPARGLCISLARDDKGLLIPTLSPATLLMHTSQQVASLLLLALRQPSESLTQFEAHLRLLRRLPFEATPGLQASHQAWLCRCGGRLCGACFPAVSACCQRPKTCL